MGEMEKKKILLGKYEVGRLLGKGTFVKVYYAKPVSSDEHVAIKVIKKEEVIKDEKMMEQIKLEISTMRMVRHPNIVELKEVMATKSKIFFVMEYVRGGELFARVKCVRLNEASARKYFQQIVSVVDFCHNIYHRDIKPEKINLHQRDSH